MKPNEAQAIRRAYDLDMQTRKLRIEASDAAATLGAHVADWHVTDTKTLEQIERDLLRVAHAVAALRAHHDANNNK